MGISINIDETIRKPNVRPPAPVSKRGPITFIAEIEESNGRDLYRNLTRGVNQTDDIVVPTPPIGDRNVSLGAVVLSLSVSSDFTFPQNVEVPLSEINVDLTVLDIETQVPDQLDLSTISVELTNLIELNNGLVVTDDEFLSLTLPEPAFRIPVSAPLSEINVDLTVLGIETVATGNRREALDNLIVDLTNQLETQNRIDAGVISTDLTNDLESQVEVTLEPVPVDLTVDMTTTAPNLQALDNLIVELSSEAAVNVVQNSDVSATFTAEIEVTTGFTAEADPVELSIEEPELNIESNFDAVIIDLSVATIETEATNNVRRALDTVNVDLSQTEALDVGLNIQLPADMESAQDDDTTTIG